MVLTHLSGEESGLSQWWNLKDCHAQAQPCSVRGAPKPAKLAPPGRLSPPGENQPLQELELCIQLFLLALPFLPEYLLLLFMKPFIWHPVMANARFPSI